MIQCVPDKISDLNLLIWDVARIEKILEHLNICDVELQMLIYLCSKKHKKEYRGNTIERPMPAIFEDLTQKKTIQDTSDYEPSSEIHGYLINIKEGSIINAKTKIIKSLFEDDRHSYISFGKSKQHNRTSNWCCAVDGLVWRHKYGKIPDNMEVYHVNGNIYDNRIDNLILSDKKT